MNLAHAIRTRRVLYGLSQVELAVLANVSLPTVQNIEASRANPSLETIKQLLGRLDLRLTLSPSEYDLDKLTRIGVPLMSLKNQKKIALSNKLILQEVVRAACFLQETREIHSREVEAFEAYLLALQIHYPTLYNKACRSEAVTRFVPHKITGKHIKLRRIAVRSLSELLK